MSRIRTSNEGFSEILLVGYTGWRREGGRYYTVDGLGVVG